MVFGRNQNTTIIKPRGMMNYEAAKAFILHKLETELAAHLTYHGVHHTLDVLQMVEEIGDLEEVQADDMVLLKTAALFHDSGFTVSAKEHEVLGCEITRSWLPQFGYDALQVEVICGMIMATKIPQNPQTHLEEILCDADLDYLGRSDFYPIGQTLFEELKAFDIIQNIADWNRIQVRFLQAHQYHTATNVARRTPIKKMYLEELRVLVEQYDLEEKKD